MKKTGKVITTIVLIALFVLMCLIILASGNAGSFSANSSIRINEVMTSNKDAIPDANGNYYDWVELYNVSDNDIDISGFALSDDPLSIGKFVFPAGTIISAKGYVVIYCSGVEGLDGLYAPYKLSDDETLVLLDTTGRIIESLDLYTVMRGHTINRAEDDTWFEFNPTPGYQNSEEGLAAYRDSIFSAGQADGLYINEFMASNATTMSDCDGDYSDWIELYNSTDEAINLYGYYLSDDIEDIRAYAIPEGTIIPAKGYLIIYCSGKSIDPSIQLHAPFKLSSFSEAVVLSAPNGSIVDSYSYSNQEVDVSMARLPDATGEFTICTYPSPGYPNTEDGALNAKNEYGMKMGDLYISEMMGANYSYAKFGEEFVDWLEIHNKGTEAINLNGYGLSDDANEIMWLFPDITIEPNGYLLVYCTGVVAADESSLQTPFKLSASGESVYLFNEDGKLIDMLSTDRFYADQSVGKEPDGTTYRYRTPTPGAANSSGTNMASAPSLSLSAGSYSGVQTVSVTIPEGTTVHYTLDGSIPNESSAVYSEPLQIRETSVLRVAAVESGCLQSRTVSATYIIDDPHELPVVGLIADPDEHNYIYTNYDEEKEIAMHMDFLVDGALEYSEDGILRIFGAFSRQYEQKGYALIARAGITTSSTFQYPFFESRDFTEYSSLVLRASGQEHYMSRIRDIVVTSLVEDHTDLVVQAYRQCVVYVNGVYRGVYNLREKINKSFLLQHYPDADEATLDLLVGSGNRDYYVLQGDNADYLAMVDFAANNDMTDQRNYEYICSLMDVDNFATYTAMQLYCGNTDTGNIKFWRSAGRKWQWITYDFCWALNAHVGDIVGYKYDNVYRYLGRSGHGVNAGFSNRLIRALLTNNDFKRMFLEKCAYMADVVFSPENLNARIDECADRIRSEMPRDAELWELMTYTGWENSIERLHTYADNRKPYFVYHIRDFFELSEKDCMDIFGLDGSNPDA